MLTTPEEITSIISNFKNKKSAGSDETKRVYIEKMYKHHCASLAEIINKSFKQGTFLKKLKH